MQTLSPESQKIKSSADVPREDEDLATGQDAIPLLQDGQTRGVSRLPVFKQYCQELREWPALHREGGVLRRIKKGAAVERDRFTGLDSFESRRLFPFRLFAWGVHV